MKKIWVLRYDDGTADVWDEEKGPPSWPYVDAFDVDGALKELHSDYASLLACHNALREVLAWERECDGLLKFIDRFWDDDNVPGREAMMSYTAARAEVDRLLQEPPC